MKEATARLAALAIERTFGDGRYDDTPRQDKSDARARNVESRKVTVRQRSIRGIVSQKVTDGEV